MTGRIATWTCLPTRRRGMTLVDVGGIVDEVEKLVGVKVGVLTPGALRAGMFESVMTAFQPFSKGFLRE